MKNRIRNLAAFFLVFALWTLISLSSKAQTGYHWVLDEDQARIQYVNDATNEPVKSQFMKIKGYTYYFDKNGYAATGFTKINGFYYFFRSNGSMVINQWQAERYFLEDGRMAVSQYVKDSTGQKVYVGKDGRVISNYKPSKKAKFVKTKNETRYRNADGTYSKKTWQCINGYWYYFYSSGYMARKTKLGQFYVNAQGRMVTNKWVTIGKYKYYYGSDGILQKKVRIKTKTSKPNKVITVN